jgi:hypothetical protein
MHVLCEFNIGRAMPSSERYLGETDQTDFSPLKVGESYLVFGLLFILNRIDFLVCAPSQNPLWAPSSLFKLLDARIPDGWKICMTQSNPDYVFLFDMFKIHAILGYPSLTNKYAHYIGILERDPNEVQRFFEEKHQVDEWWSLTRQNPD